MSNPVTTQVTTNEVYLSSPAQWDDWIIKRKVPCIAKGIWKYVDPEIEPILIETLHEPLPPSIKDIKEGATYATLDREERSVYHHEKEMWVIYRRDWERKQKDIATLLEDILKTLDQRYITLIADKESPYEVLRALRTQFKPQQAVKEGNAIREWRTLQNGGEASKGVEDWLTRWETTYTKCQKLNLPDVTGNRPAWDFINAVNQQVDSNWGQLMTTKLLTEQETILEFRSLVDQFRGFYRIKRQMPQRRGNHATFMASSGDYDDDNDNDAPKPTWNGKDRNGKYGGGDRKCICDQQHPLRKCYYIVGGPNNWTPNQQRRELVEKKIASINKLRKLVDKIKEEAKAKEASGGAAPPIES